MVRTSLSAPATAASVLQALVIGNPTREQILEESWLPPLPFSETEANIVGAMYPQSLVLTGKKATKGAFLANLKRYSVVHYSGHAVVNEQDPSRSRLLMAHDATSDDDGSLLMTELAPVRLDKTRLVVLAACSTGAGQLSNGEGVLSIARPFLEAGAASVVATLWEIPDKSAARLFEEFHRRVARGEMPAVALTYVQRAFIEQSDAAWQSPSQWAWAVSIGGFALP